MKIETIKLYSDRNDVTLTSYVLEKSRELTGDRKRPAVLICPGGAFIMCSDREAEPIALRFAAMGFHAFVLRYSTYIGFGGGNVNWADIKPFPEIVYPAPLRDMGKAMLYIKEHAEEWLVDDSKIIISGGSAGGFLCAQYATNWHKSVLSEHFKESAEKFRPAAAILYYPITDYVEMEKNMEPKADQMAQGIHKIASLALMGTTTPTDSLLEELSPVRQVSEKTPPMFIWTTGADEQIPAKQSMLMGIALAEKGIPFEIHLFEEGTHGLSLATQASAQTKKQINADVAKWVDLAEAWLMKRFALDLPAEIQMPNPFQPKR